MEIKPKYKEWTKLARDIMLLALLIFGARSAIADWNHVPTGSMKPTIVEGDLIFVNRLAYDLKVPFTTWHIAKWDDPKHNEIVVFFSPANGDRLVKRIVGVPGDTVAMHRNRVFLNGKPLSYIPLDKKFLRPLTESDQKRYQFALEQLMGNSHPVMILGDDPPGSTFGPIMIPAGKYLVLGDNRDNSADSRYIGLIDRNAIVGRATSIIASWNRDHFYLPRKDRFFVSLP
ncbi:MAG: signal peptidase I [Acidiferrobacterales bacterium]